MKKKLHNLLKGKISENIAVNWFIENKFTIYQSLVDIEKIDFIARKIHGGKAVKPHYFEIQVKGNTKPSFYVPRREYGWSNDHFYYVFVHSPKDGQPKIYLMSQEEIRKVRYKSTRKLSGKKPKQFEKRIVVVKFSKEEQIKYDINKRKHLLNRKNV